MTATDRERHSPGTGKPLRALLSAPATRCGSFEQETSGPVRRPTAFRSDLKTRRERAGNPIERSRSEGFPGQPMDLKGGRIGNGHHGHHAGLDRIAHHEVRSVGNASCHVQTDDDQTLVAHLTNRVFDFSAHQRPGENQRPRTRQARHSLDRFRDLRFSDQRNRVDRDTFSREDCDDPPQRPRRPRLVRPERRLR